MECRRVIALARKELEEVGWIGLGSAVLGVVVVSVGVAARVNSDYQPAAALLDLLVVASLTSLILAERQGADLGTATRRHLLTLPLQPAEIAAAKALAFMTVLLASVFVGIAAYAAMTHALTHWIPAPLVLIDGGGRIVLFVTVCWSMELASASWPRVGLATVLTLIALYAVGLALFPVLREHFNVVHLLLLWVDGVGLAGPALAASALAVIGLLTTVYGLWSREVAE